MAGGAASRNDLFSERLGRFDIEPNTWRSGSLFDRAGPWHRAAVMQDGLRLDLNDPQTESRRLSCIDATMRLVNQPGRKRGSIVAIQLPTPGMTWSSPRIRPS